MVPSCPLYQGRTATPNHMPQFQKTDRSNAQLTELAMEGINWSPQWFPYGHPQNLLTGTRYEILDTCCHTHRHHNYDTYLFIVSSSSCQSLPLSRAVYAGERAERSRLSTWAYSCTRRRVKAFPHVSPKRDGAGVLPCVGSDILFWFSSASVEFPGMPYLMSRLVLF